VEDAASVYGCSMSKADAAGESRCGGRGAPLPTAHRVVLKSARLTLAALQVVRGVAMGLGPQGDCVRRWGVELYRQHIVRLSPVGAVRIANTSRFGRGQC
jgi:hypothetical protein